MPLPPFQPIERRIISRVAEVFIMAASVHAAQFSGRKSR
jgi:hypothetical protein